MSAPANVNRWTEPEWARSYLRERDSIPHRVEGLEVMLELLPERVDRVLDLGTGDGNTLALVLGARPGAEGVGLDFQDEMLNRASERFAGDARVTIARHDLDDTLPERFGDFDLVVSSFAIHHVTHTRKRELYEEIHGLLSPGGVFLNLEHVSSATTALHHQFLAIMQVAPEDEDPSNKLLDVETQLGWMRTIGFVDVDCLWKWRELALLAATRSAVAERSSASAASRRLPSVEGRSAPGSTAATGAASPRAISSAAALPSVPARIVTPPSIGEYASPMPAKPGAKGPVIMRLPAQDTPRAGRARRLADSP